MAALEKPLEGPAALTLNRGAEHGPIGLGNAAVGENRGESKVEALDLRLEGISDHLVVEGARSVDRTLGS